MIIKLAVIIVRKHYPCGRTWANILQFVWLWVSSITTGTRRIMRSDELPFVVRCSRRISEECSYRRAIETHNQTNYKCLPSSPRKIMRPQCKNGQCVFSGQLIFFKKNLFNKFDRFLLYSNSKFYLPGTLSGLVRNFFFSIY